MYSLEHNSSSLLLISKKEKQIKLLPSNFECKDVFVPKPLVIVSQVIVVAQSFWF